MTIDHGALSISGQRKPAVEPGDGKRTLHIDERFDGRFRRVISLPEDSDSTSVQAMPKCRRRTAGAPSD